MRKRIGKTFLLIFCILTVVIRSQVTNIGGVVNIYTPVTLIDTTLCPPKVTVTNSSGFLVGDKVLIIQMKGAEFDTSNTASFGNLINLKGAGNYEIAKINSISGNNIILNGKLTNQYNLNGSVQLVRIPTYVDANVTSLLTCQPWNGKTGGVLIFNVQNNLQLFSDIDASGKGFRGGTISKNPDGGCGFGSNLFHYPLYQPGFSWNYGGAQKGEGICDIDTARIAGRGPMINGGGGGNKHNTGGGGGSNFTNGGKGGNGLEGCSAITGGIGGNGLGVYYNNSKLFAGGGGGCGDDNNGVGSDGENGGGIIIIIANSITGNNYKVKSNGNSVTIIGSGIADGAGGGGAGGSVFIKTNSASILNVEANGGDGGKQSPTWGCVGPGGGGGTGTILTNLSTLSGINTSLLPGAAGVVFNTMFTCNNTTYGAVAGAPNTVGVLKNKNLVYTIDSLISCHNFETGLKDIIAVKKETILIYPDPANSFISIKNGNGKRISSIRIINNIGETVYELKENMITENSLNEINIRGLANGVFNLEITYENNVARGRFIKIE